MAVPYNPYSWYYSGENPFNQMDYTRGGGGLDNSSTTESNERRNHAMVTGVSALPRYASATEAQKAYDNGNVPVFQSVSQALTFARKYGVRGVLQVAGGARVHTTHLSLGTPKVPGTAKPVAKQPVKPKPLPTSKPVTEPLKNSPLQVPSGVRPNGEGASGGSGPGNPQVTSGLPATAGPGSAGAGFSYAGLSGLGANGNEVITFSGDTRYQDIRVGNDYVTVDTEFPTVEDFWEPWYGEPGEMVGGTLNMMVHADLNSGRLVRNSITIAPGSVADKLINHVNDELVYRESYDYRYDSAVEDLKFQLLDKGFTDAFSVQKPDPYSGILR